MGVEENPRRLPALKEALMKIVLLVVGPIAVGLFWSGQGTGLFSGPHNAVLIDAGGGALALTIGFFSFALPEPPPTVLFPPRPPPPTPPTNTPPPALSHS